MPYALRTFLAGLAVAWTALFWISLAKVGGDMPSGWEVPESLGVLSILAAVVAWSLPMTMIGVGALLVRRD